MTQSVRLKDLSTYSNSSSRREREAPRESLRVVSGERKNNRDLSLRLLRQARGRYFLAPTRIFHDESIRRNVSALQAFMQYSDSIDTLFTRKPRRSFRGIHP